MPRNHYSSQNHCHRLFNFSCWLCSHVAQWDACHCKFHKFTFVCRFVYCILMILVCNSHSTVSSEKEICLFIQQIPSCIQGSYLNHGSSDTIDKHLPVPVFSSAAFFGLVLPFYLHIHLKLL